MKTYKTWEMITGEMIKEITKNPSREFTRKSDGLHIKANEHGELIWDSGYQFLRLYDEWEEVKKPVDFITAIKSGKHVGVEYSGAKYEEMSLPNLFYELQQDYSDKAMRQMILNGKWYIED